MARSKLRWKAHTRPVCYRISDDAKQYIRTEAKKYDCTETLVLNSILLTLRNKGRSIRPLAKPLDKSYRLEQSLKQLTPEQKKKAKSQQYAEIRRNNYQYKRRSKEVF